MSAVVQEQRRLHTGRHQHPDDGSCLMEYVSMLAGHSFTDAPRCTDLLLAELARMVNDTIGDRARSSLVGLAPRLVALPRAPHRAAAPSIVVAALDVVLRGRPDRTDLLRHRRRALRIAATGEPRHRLLAHLKDGFYRHGPARHALACAVYVATEHPGPNAEPDTVLAAMLDASMAVLEESTAKAGTLVHA